MAQTVLVVDDDPAQRRILEEVVRRDGYRVLVPERLSPNDGAISYGQAAVAAARLSAGLPAN